MKKLLYLSVFLLAFLLKAEGQSAEDLSYNLKSGDKFYYEVYFKELEQNTHKLTQWIEFEVARENRKGYDMVMRFKRIRENLNSKQFDSKAYYPQEVRNPLSSSLLYQLVIDQAIHFKLGTKGEISEIRLSAPLKETIKREIRGIFNKNNLVKTSILAPDELFFLIRNIFKPYPPNQDTEWADTYIPKREGPVHATKYTLSSSNDSTYTIRLNRDYNNIDSVAYGNSTAKVVPIKIMQEAEAEIDAKSGLMMASTGESISDVKQIFMLDMKQEFRARHRAQVIIEQKQSFAGGDRTVIAGRFPKSIKKDLVKFFIWNNFVDNDLARLELKPAADNSFHGTLSLERHTELSVNSEGPDGRNKYHDKLLVFPGDSIFMVFDDLGHATFSGRGALKSKVLNEVRKVGKIIKSHVGKEEALETLQKKYEC